MALINCPQCGHRISDKATACPKCGYVVNREPEKVVFKPIQNNRPATTPPFPPSVPPVVPSAEPQYDETPDDNGGRGNGLKWLLIVIAVLLVGGGVGYYFYFAHKAKLEAEYKAFMADSLRRDSIAAVERAAFVADSIRRDSIAEVEAFVANVPTFEEVYRFYDQEGDAFFKKRGFTKSVKEKTKLYPGYDVPLPERTTIWILRLDAKHYCIYKVEHTPWTWDYSLTIMGAPDKLALSKQQAGREESNTGQSEEGPGNYISIDGDVINWGDYSGD